jgi:AcrR family transcriptional regulator
VPRRVDHTERRRQIADALVRTAATRGLHATGMREVAAEAGVSLRLVQYYFGTKEELLLAAMQHLAAQFSDRAMARIRQSRQGDGPASPRDIIGAILAEGVPAGLDPDLEAISLMTMSAGLGTSVLGGHSSPGQAQAVIDYHLDRLFPRPVQHA